jgi:hypothetical protein
LREAASAEGIEEANSAEICRCIFDLGKVVEAGSDTIN